MKKSMLPYHTLALSGQVLGKCEGAAFWRHPKSQVMTVSIRRRFSRFKHLECTLWMRLWEVPFLWMVMPRNLYSFRTGMECCCIFRQIGGRFRLLVKRTAADFDCEI